MIIKPRGIPLSLQIRRFLKPRMLFSDRDLRQLAADEKGYLGECLFDHMIAESPASSYLQLHDLMLEWNHTTFQIDTLLISPHKIYLFDVKNYDGEFYIEGDQWYWLSGKEIKNPIPQLQRCESLLRPLLQTLGIHLPIEAKLVFVNPEFTLFQADRHLPILLPTQINSFIKRLGSVSMEVNEDLIVAAKKLASLHDENSSYYKSNIPFYDFGNLKKGAACCKCGSLSTHVCGKDLECEVCGTRETLKAAILRAISEHQLLFPGRLITVPEISEWTGNLIGRARMQIILRDNFTMIGKGKSTQYIYPKI